MSEWQPIETAPRDETTVLLAWKFGLGCALAFWVADDESWVTQDAVRMKGDTRFSHWMPLPEPPA